MSKRIKWHTRYSEEYKRHAVSLVEQEGLSTAQVATSTWFMLACVSIVKAWANSSATTNVLSSRACVVKIAFWEKNGEILTKRALQARRFKATTDSAHSHLARGAVEAASIVEWSDYYEKAMELGFTSS